MCDHFGFFTEWSIQEYHFTGTLEQFLNNVTIQVPRCMKKINSNAFILILKTKVIE